MAILDRIMSALGMRNRKKRSRVSRYVSEMDVNRLRMKIVDSSSGSEVIFDMRSPMSISALPPVSISRSSSDSSLWTPSASFKRVSGPVPRKRHGDPSSNPLRLCPCSLCGELSSVPAIGNILSPPRRARKLKVPSPVSLDKFL
ncbi:hypothetical protein KM540_gp034 [Western grey kangaroopox virus]|uniref:Uncharacterized protein n=1 Tax=Western grey kangaroopox virus TaxID=1566307 RepID=A0A2C9DSI2_9POXV|nr:hypothetical protein KM540_gp034 [Western grey kangaroopox virus]ATI20965.1 hypothetical protein [Western grey kangaroopox virus]